MEHLAYLFVPLALAVLAAATVAIVVLAAPGNVEHTPKGALVAYGTYVVPGNAVFYLGFVARALSVLIIALKFFTPHRLVVAAVAVAGTAAVGEFVMYLALAYSSVPFAFVATLVSAVGSALVALYVMRSRNARVDIMVQPNGYSRRKAYVTLLDTIDRSGMHPRLCKATEAIVGIIVGYEAVLLLVTGIAVIVETAVAVPIIGGLFIVWATLMPASVGLPAFLGAALFSIPLVAGSLSRYIDAAMTASFLGACAGGFVLIAAYAYRGTLLSAYA